ncbi:MAG: hypothetical protein K6F00_06305 [Lachnospiraceae bacterium]|nr:hypothetical protein [Lachnospiraceae bacterium]
MADQINDIQNNEHLEINENENNNNNEGRVNNNDQVNNGRRDDQDNAEPNANNNGRANQPGNPPNANQPGNQPGDNQNNQNDANANRPPVDPNNIALNANNVPAGHKNPDEQNATDPDYVPINYENLIGAGRMRAKKIDRRKGLKRDKLSYEVDQLEDENEDENVNLIFRKYANAFEQSHHEYIINFKENVLRIHREEKQNNGIKTTLINLYKNAKYKILDDIVDAINVVKQKNGLWLDDSSYMEIGKYVSAYKTLVDHCDAYAQEKAGWSVEWKTFDHMVSVLKRRVLEEQNYVTECIALYQGILPLKAKSEDFFDPEKIKEFDKFFLDKVGEEVNKKPVISPEKRAEIQYEKGLTFMKETFGSSRGILSEDDYKGTEEAKATFKALGMNNLSFAKVNTSRVISNVKNKGRNNVNDRTNTASKDIGIIEGSIIKGANGLPTREAVVSYDTLSGENYRIDPRKEESFPDNGFNLNFGMALAYIFLATGKINILTEKDFLYTVGANKVIQAMNPLKMPKMTAVTDEEKSKWVDELKKIPSNNKTIIANALDKLSDGVKDKDAALTEALGNNSEGFKSRLTFMKDFINEDIELGKEVDEDIEEQEKEYLKVHTDEKDRKKLSEEETGNYQRINSLFENGVFGNMLHKLDILSSKKKRQKAGDREEYVEKQIAFQKNIKDLVNYDRLLEIKKRKGLEIEYNDDIQDKSIAFGILLQALFEPSVSYTYKPSDMLYGYSIADKKIKVDRAILNRVPSLEKLPAEGGDEAAKNQMRSQMDNIYKTIEGKYADVIRKDILPVFRETQGFPEEVSKRLDILIKYEEDIKADAINALESNWDERKKNAIAEEQNKNDLTTVTEYLDDAEAIGKPLFVRTLLSEIPGFENVFTKTSKRVITLKNNYRQLTDKDGEAEKEVSKDFNACIYEGVKEDQLKKYEENILYVPSIGKKLKKLKYTGKMINLIFAGKDEEIDPAKDVYYSAVKTVQEGKTEVKVNDATLRIEPEIKAYDETFEDTLSEKISTMLSENALAAPFVTAFSNLAGGERVGEDVKKRIILFNTKYSQRSTDQDVEKQINDIKNAGNKLVVIDDALKNQFDLVNDLFKETDLVNALLTYKTISSEKQIDGTDKKASTAKNVFYYNPAQTPQFIRDIAENKAENVDERSMNLLFSTYLKANLATLLVSGKILEFNPENYIGVYENKDNEEEKVITGLKYSGQIPNFSDKLPDADFNQTCNDFIELTGQEGIDKKSIIDVLKKVIEENKKPTVKARAEIVLSVLIDKTLENELDKAEHEKVSQENAGIAFGDISEKINDIAPYLNADFPVIAAAIPEMKEITVRASFEEKRKRRTRVHLANNMIHGNEYLQGEYEDVNYDEEMFNKMKALLTAINFIVGGDADTEVSFDDFFYEYKENEGNKAEITKIFFRKLPDVKADPVPADGIQRVANKEEIKTYFPELRGCFEGNNNLSDAQKARYSGLLNALNLRTLAKDEYEKEYDDKVAQMRQKRYENAKPIETDKDNSYLDRLKKKRHFKDIVPDIVTVKLAQNDKRSMFNTQYYEHDLYARFKDLMDDGVAGFEMEETEDIKTSKKKAGILTWAINYLRSGVGDTDNFEEYALPNLLYEIEIKIENNDNIYRLKGVYLKSLKPVELTEDITREELVKRLNHIKEKINGENVRRYFEIIVDLVTSNNPKYSGKFEDAMDIVMQ